MESQHHRTELDGLSATSGRLRQLAISLQLTEAGYASALRAAGLVPDAPAWRRLIGRFLLIYAAALIIAGIAAFFAYNWADLHRFAKFGLIQAGIVTGVWLAWRRGLGSLAGGSALFAAAFLTGVLLAVYGQTYQTGADPYGLFLGWAVFVAGWAIIGRQPALWLLMAVLANLTLVLYWEQVLHPQEQIGDLFRVLGPLAWFTGMLTDSRLAQLVFALNASMLVVWEYFAARGIAWMRGRWFPRLLASAALATIATTTLIMIFASLAEAGLGMHYGVPVWYVLFTMGCLWYYQHRCPDLFILAACLLGGIVVITAFLARVSGGGFDIALVLSLLVIGQTAGAGFWLRSVARRWGGAR